ncbi:uncharacterized protein [Onthophagus taurus]|uniref:uncharacterized protein n=1 Tax=Onthophagus taurus TaxID=166361 RepID=UPI0039BEBAF5
MSQDGFSQIDLTAPGFASQESFLLNSFDINLLNMSTVEKALDPNVQPNEQPMDPNVESNVQQATALPNIAGSSKVDDKNVKHLSLSLRRKSGNREHRKKGAAKKMSGSNNFGRVLTLERRVASLEVKVDTLFQLVNSIVSESAVVRGQVHVQNMHIHHCSTGIEPPTPTPAAPPPPYEVRDEQEEEEEW